ncbi:MAG: acylphosphatase [Elusimicrobia bacterium]|nr:acylphosphatase [Elusimicrobiota bacterium]MBI3012211.1 acylphosphatase [Elusimicrobiota bacterium]
MRLRLRIQGGVQGVGYRFFVVQRAKRENLTGWVRNCSNGDVESEVQGDPTRLEGFIRDIENGHHWASVERIIKEPMNEIVDEKDFEIAV